MSEKHSHNHSHSHNVVPANINKAFVIGIILNLLYVIIQVVIGFRINSLSLLSDAGHNFLDVAGLGLSMIAFKLMQSKTTEKYTYGYRKASILISLLNAVILLISIGAIGYEAIFRFANPQPIPGITIAIIASIGIVINGVSAFLFFKDKEKDINIKSAFLHLLSDALVSSGLILGGIIIYYTHWFWIDPLLSIIICLVIIASMWRLLKDSLRLSLDGVPENTDFDTIKAAALKISGINSIHHIHIWAISTTENAMTAHLVINEDVSPEQLQVIKMQFRHQMEHENIHHITLETEYSNCENFNC
ncbi:cation diffusion facilitator family transporter [Flavobacterium sp. MDT1-60]|uniref:cation diffusion facilitator family transporter n=1 Tax=Flavobacterium sp. MDT1-60 TaxID=1979344 RepID=UPI001786E5F8|nr:cation diffusion facilitator family transporter [Flavobacterium sp. MDT1-60]QOG01156.1 cation transporter [Flavobacterium sp. MDT1-60]